MDDTTLNRTLYLPPEQLTANEANEKARPSESPVDRQQRVREMAESLRVNGQEVPVLIVEIDEGDSVTYEYVDGGCRVEAMALLNEDRAAPQPVWCVLVDPEDDLFRRAVVANLHRTQNSIMDMAHIVQEAQERNNWTGRGAGLKVAEYLGLAPGRVSEYQKVMRAPASIKQKIESGEIGSLDAALKLLSVPNGQQQEVVERAEEIAEEESHDSVRVGNDNQYNSVVAPDNQEHSIVARTSNTARKPTVKAKHVTRAAREVSGATPPRTKAEILDFFVGGTVDPYSDRVQEFCAYLTAVWAKGQGTDKKLAELFDAMVGKRAAKPVAKKKGGKK